MAGCTTNSGDAQNLPTENETTGTETATRDDCRPRPEKFPDLTIENSKATPTEVEVVIRYREKETRNLKEYYRETATIEVGSSHIVRDAFESGTPSDAADDSAYFATVRADGDEARRDVRSVVTSPHNYGIEVDVTPNGIDVVVLHADPPTADDWCPTPTDD